MPFSKKHKSIMQDQYRDWVGKSQAMIMVEYTGLDMKGINTIRSKARDAGGEFHVVKNTLLINIFKEKGIAYDQKMLEGSTAVGFAFKDAAGLAKAFQEFTKGNEVFKIKGGYLGENSMSKAQVVALADLPPLPVIRSTLLGVLQAPAGKLVRTLAEPARSMASVVKAYADKAATAAA